MSEEDARALPAAAEPVEPENEPSTAPALEAPEPEPDDRPAERSPDPGPRAEAGPREEAGSRAEAGPRPVSGTRPGPESRPESGSGPGWDGAAKTPKPPPEFATGGDTGPMTADAGESSLGYEGERQNDRTRRLRQEFRAENIGDVAGRDINHHYHAMSGERLTAGPISTARLRRAMVRYVATPTDGDLTDFPAGERLVFLRGRVGTGRRTSAVDALDRLTGRTRAAGRVTVLQSSARFTAVADRIDNGHGHLLDASGEDWVVSVDEAEVAYLEDELAKRAAYLIVLTDTMADQRLPHRVVDHEIPDLRQVLDFHVAAALAGPEGHVTDTFMRGARALIDEARGAFAEVTAWHDEITGTDVLAAPGEAAQLAEVIVDWNERRSRDPSAVPRVRHYRDQRRFKRARELLRNGSTSDGSPLQQAYVISAAVLDGLPVSEVVDGAGQLAGLLQQVEHPGETSGRRVFGEPLHRWLSHVRLTAQAVDEQDGGSPALRPRAATSVVTMPDRRLARVIVEVAWTEYDAARGPMLSWLIDLCEHATDLRVQVRAVQALAVIAGHDYAQVQEKVLKRWWESERPVQHRAAAWLLEALALDDLLEPKVLDVLRRWSRSGLWQQRAIAVRAYGTWVATRAPEDAITCIRISATDPERRFTKLTEWALREMYILGLRREVLDALTFWTFAVLPMREQAARTLVRLARLRRVRETDGAGEHDRLAQRSRVEERDGAGEYDLLWQAAKSRDALGIDLSQLAALWRLACTHPASSGAGWQMLRIWGESCLKNAELRPTFDELIKLIATEPKLRARIRFYRRLWNRTSGKKEST
jgi:hypothetical protein